MWIDEVAYGLPRHTEAVGALSFNSNAQWIIDSKRHDETMTAPEITVPPKPRKPEKKDDAAAYAVETALYTTELTVWAEDYKDYQKKLSAWENSQTRMFNLTL